MPLLIAGQDAPLTYGLAQALRESGDAVDFVASGPAADAALHGVPLDFSAREFGLRWNAVP